MLLQAFAQRFTVGSEVDGDLHDELERLGLGHISGILDALGVMQWDDLGLLSDDELAEAGVRLVQRKRLRLAAGNAATGVRAPEFAPGTSETLLLLPALSQQPPRPMHRCSRQRYQLALLPWASSRRSVRRRQ